MKVSAAVEGGAVVVWAVREPSFLDSVSAEDGRTLRGQSHTLESN